ncbi:hypothetical protein MB9_0749 [Methanobacterium formicicum]|uniref:Uncharacterized protein n=1 Tax=Methanobacterium formicicum TaxID=2162 RepID=A0A0S4FN10_METFO|nr:hypothetical protein MB9_0749 [Methanobacterium formicicum]
MIEGLRNESLMNKAYNLIQQGKYHDAIGYYDKILESDSHHVNASYGKGLIFQRWGCMGMLWSFMIRFWS